MAIWNTVTLYPSDKIIMFNTFLFYTKSIFQNAESFKIKIMSKYFHHSNFEYSTAGNLGRLLLEVVYELYSIEWTESNILSV